MGSTVLAMTLPRPAAHRGAAPGGDAGAMGAGLPHGLSGDSTGMDLDKAMTWWEWIVVTLFMLAMSFALCGRNLI